MQQVHLFQLILHFWCFLQDGREKSFFEMDIWPWKQRGRSARRTDCHRFSFPPKCVQGHLLKMPREGYTHEWTLPCMQSSLSRWCFLQRSPFLLARQEAWHSLPVCQPCGTLTLLSWAWVKCPSPFHSYQNLAFPAQLSISQ